MAQTKEQKTYDLIVIGGGSGGIASARRAAKHGQSVLVFEGKRLGGTCVNVGCVPKKVMFNASHVAEMMDFAPDYGFAGASRGAFDFKAFKKKRDAYIDRLNGIYARNLGKDDIATVSANASFVDPHTVEAEGKHYSAKRFLIATGGYPFVPDCAGAELGIDSDAYFNHLDTIPDSVAIIGSGYIAVELAGVMNALGSKVKVLVRHDKVLKFVDTDVREAFEEEMARQGIELVKGAKTDSFTRTAGTADGVDIHCKDGRVISDQKLLIWAIGRKPLTAELGLDKAGVALDDSGFIAIDDWQATNVPHIFAVGDVTDRPQLTPVAIKAGRQLMERLYNDKPEAKLDYELVPSVVFSHPPIGTVGLTEQQAKDKFGASEVTCYTSRFVNMFYSMLEEKPKTVMKIVTVGPDEKVVGIHGMGLGMDEIIQGFAVPVAMGATKADLDAVIAIHPTAAEELVTMA